MTTMEAIPQIQPMTHQPKDITALFNQLQVNVNQCQSRLSDGTTSTLSISSSSTTHSAPPITQHQLELEHTSSSTATAINNSDLSSSSSQEHPPNTACPCHHWLVSIDSEHCGLCDTPHSTMVNLQAERTDRMKRLRAYKRQWMDMTATKDQQQNDMMSLQRTILEHRESLMAYEEDMASLQQDIEMLHSKCKDESAQVEAIELAKQAAKREIEDLGQHLFQEAQEMIGIEQQEKAILRASCNDLKQQLEQTQMDLDQTVIQLQALRMDIGRWGDHQDEQQEKQHLIPINTNTPTSPTFNNNSNINNSSIIGSSENDTNDYTENTESGRSSTATALSSSSSSSISTPTSSSYFSSSSPLMTETSQKFLIRAKLDLTALQNGGHIGNLQLETFEDDQQLLDFQEFIDSATSTSFSLRKLHGLPFIKMCLADDIEPCLRFGPHPKMTNGKRILEAIQIKTCFVEKCPPGFAREQAALLHKEKLAKKNKPSLWDKLAASATNITTTTTTTTTISANDTSATTTNNSTTTPATTSTTEDQDSHLSLSCATCGRLVVDAATTEKDLAYRFRMSYFDEWACIDRYCADRLTSVISFYSFLRQLRIGDFKGRSLMDIYQECSRLRLSMFLSRLGAFPPSITST